MLKKEFTYRGKTMEELKKLSLNEFIKLIPARQRRTLSKGFTEQQKRLLLKIKKAKDGNYKKIIKTHCRNLIILPEMIDSVIYVHSGKEFSQVRINEEMIGHYLGEFVLTRKRIAHSSPGVGATKSSSSAATKKK